MAFTHADTTLRHKRRFQKHLSPGALLSIFASTFDASNHERASLRKEQSQAVRHLLHEALVQSKKIDKDASWTLSKTQDGKPYLQDDAFTAISLSHSAHWVACAVGHARSIGIDIEIIRQRNWHACCEYFCHKEESEWILAGSKEEQDIRGLICWCRKEALTKALGVGNTVPLAEIAFTPDGVLFSLPAQLGAVADWTSDTNILQNQSVMATVWKN